MLRGIGTSKGIGIGHALVLKNVECEVRQYEIKDTEAEIKRFKDGVDAFVRETDELIEKLAAKLNGDDSNALVLKNQEYLAKDIQLISQVEDIIKTGKVNAEAALYEACDGLKKLFLSMDNEAMAQRVSDIEDMRVRLTSILLGVKNVDLTQLEDNTIIIADEIHPSMTANMDTEHIAGIISEKGGDTSHASILARALEIPAVLSVKGICSSVNDGQEIIIDGAYGEVFVEPSAITTRIYEKKKRQYDESVVELKKYINKQTMTKDGRRVMLAANIGNALEAAKAVKDGAEGVGLFRTEFLFMN